MSIHLIIGGARSGKSSFAEKQAKDLEENELAQVYYLATAQSLDDEMSTRIKRHQQQRPEHWALFESPIELANVIQQLIRTHQRLHKTPITVLVDCLTLWLSNCLCSFDKACWHHQKQALLNVLNDYVQTSEVNILLVSNEVGHGIVPMGDLSRDFVDQSGWLHQDIAAIATNVDFVMAGIALSLKSKSVESRE